MTIWIAAFTLTQIPAAIDSAIDSGGFWVNMSWVQIVTVGFASVLALVNRFVLEGMA